MNTRKTLGPTESRPGQQGLSEISHIAGSAPPLLPGESEQGYLIGRHGAIQELGAKTPLQLYLAEKIFDCLWWMRIYETQKRATLIRIMADHLIGITTGGDRRLDITRAITEGKWTHDELAQQMHVKGLTPETLMQYAMAQKPLYMTQLDDQIALRAKTLISLQSSYESLVNRSIVQDRMRLQNDLLRRDLTSIPMELTQPDSSKVRDSQNDQPPQGRSQ
jgi:hypothetical protein